MISFDQCCALTGGGDCIHAAELLWVVDLIFTYITIYRKFHLLLLFIFAHLPVYYYFHSAI